MEYLDILNENGQPTGQKKLREDVHRDGDWHRSAHIWILNSQQELLIQKRSATKDSHPNQWDISSAGHIKAGDDFLTSAVRELEEELGIILDKSAFNSLSMVKNQEITNNGTFINNQFNEVFLIELDLDIAKLKLQAEEVAEVKFIPFRELEKIINPTPPQGAEHQGGFFTSSIGSADNLIANALTDIRAPVIESGDENFVPHPEEYKLLFSILHQRYAQ